MEEAGGRLPSVITKRDDAVDRQRSRERKGGGGGLAGSQ